MLQLNSSNPPPQPAELPILTVLKECYLVWHSFLPHLPRLTRYTLGVKIDALFTEILQIVLTAQYTKREEKMKLLEIVSRKLDTLKFFITLLWEAKGIDAKKYGAVSQKLASAGKMLGGWMKMG